jgi:hypothetical protein
VGVRWRENLGGGGQQQQEVGDSAGQSVATMHFTHQPRAMRPPSTPTRTLHTNLKLDPAGGRVGVRWRENWGGGGSAATRGRRFGRAERGNNAFHTSAKGHRIV